MYEYNHNKTKQNRVCLFVCFGTYCIMQVLRIRTIGHAQLVKIGSVYKLLRLLCLLDPWNLVGPPLLGDLEFEILYNST